MMRSVTVAAAVSLVLLLSGSMTGATDFGVGVRAGTQGLGLEGGVSTTKLLTIRAGLYGFTYDESFTEGDIRYDGELELGGMTFTPAEIGTLSGTVDFDSTAPYLGVGWGNVAKGKRLGFLFDLGVLKQGDGDVSLSASNAVVGSLLENELEVEARQIEDDISGFDLWPVISFGMSVRF